MNSDQWYNTLITALIDGRSRNSCDTCQKYLLLCCDGFPPTGTQEAVHCELDRLFPGILVQPRLQPFVARPALSSGLSFKCME